MKNLVCPISSEKTPEYMPRIVAAYVIGLLLAYIFTGFLPIIVFLVFDYALRGYGLQRYSLLNLLARSTGNLFKGEQFLIDKAPKEFAARIGLLLTFTALLFELVHVEQVASIIAIVIVVFATLESAFKFCVGCLMYTWIVLPLYNRRNR